MPLGHSLVQGLCILIIWSLSTNGISMTYIDTHAHRHARAQTHTHADTHGKCPVTNQAAFVIASYIFIINVNMYNPAYCHYVCDSSIVPALCGLFCSGSINCRHLYLLQVGRRYLAHAKSAVNVSWMNTIPGRGCFRSTSRSTRRSAFRQISRYQRPFT